MEDKPDRMKVENVNIASPPPLGNPTCRLQIEIFGLRKADGGDTVVIPVYVRRQFGEGISAVGVNVKERFVSMDLALQR